MNLEEREVTPFSLRMWQPFLFAYSLASLSRRAEALSFLWVEPVSVLCFYVFVVPWPQTLPLHLSFWRLAWYKSTLELESGPKLWSAWLEQAPPFNSSPCLPVPRELELGIYYFHLSVTQNPPFFEELLFLTKIVWFRLMYHDPLWPETLSQKWTCHQLKSHGVYIQYF